jgi:hypothetical protein
VREGSALLQGLVSCGHCGRRLHVHYRGRNSAPGYHCSGKDLVNGRGVYCLNVGGTAIEQAVADTFLQVITPAAIEAMRLSVEQLQANHDTALSQWRLEVERTRYEAERAERRYRAVEPENRLVARGLETEWENRLRDLAAAESELRRREQQRPRTISSEQLQAIQRLGSDIRQVWTATTTTDRDRKELLRTLLEEVILNLKRVEGRAHLTLRWRGGAFTTLDVPVPRSKPMGPRTAEDTISLLRRLAALYPDEVIAGILNRQGRKTATGERFTANQVGSLRRYRGIPRFQPPAEPPSVHPRILAAASNPGSRPTRQIGSIGEVEMNSWRSGNSTSRCPPSPMNPTTRDFPSQLEPWMLAVAGSSTGPVSGAPKMRAVP